MATGGFLCPRIYLYDLFEIQKIQDLTAKSFFKSLVGEFNISKIRNAVFFAYGLDVTYEREEILYPRSEWLPI